MAQHVTDHGRVHLLVRAGCHLCDEARIVLREELGEPGWHESDIDADPELLARWSEMVPVVMVDDQVVGYWRVDRITLRSALTGTE